MDPVILSATARRSICLLKKKRDADAFNGDLAPKAETDR
jgi:hypothetical protein